MSLNIISDAIFSAAGEFIFHKVHVSDFLSDSLQKLENHYLHIGIKTSAYVNYAAVPLSLPKAYKLGRPGNSHRQSCHNGSRLSNFSEELNKILID